MVFDLDFPVVSKSNHRHTTNSTSARAWRRTKAFEDGLTLLARTNLPHTWPGLAADLPVPSRPTVGLVIVASTMLDAANLPKSVCDALEGVCYANDASARAVSVLTLRSRTPRATIAVAAYAPDVDLSALASAQGDLQLLALHRFQASELEPGVDPASLDSR